AAMIDKLRAENDALRYGTGESVNPTLQAENAMLKAQIRKQETLSVRVQLDPPALSPFTVSQTAKSSIHSRFKF
ncbi:MAG: hypothetical protein V2I33_16270, partial [Kangiellaceae bacterium]|nr:hypothetical protein [Kangiellaceae bacterium]